MKLADYFCNDLSKIPPLSTCWHIFGALVFASVSAAMFHYHGFSLKAVFGIAFAALMFVQSVVDFRTQLLPVILSNTLIILGVAQGVFGIFCDWQQSLLGLVIGYGILWLIDTIYYRLRGRHGIGSGDFRLLGAIGAWVGAGSLPMIMVIAPLFGITISIATLIRQKTAEGKMATPAPFGPALAAAGIIMVIAGDAILRAWLSLVVPH